jgi:DNA-binding PadR family transcriptional regulator
MARRRRLGSATLEVLQGIVAGHSYGFEIITETGLPGGTVYPALVALERDGLVSSSWEDPEVAREDGRPPRRYYSVTSKGERILRWEVDRLRRLSALVEDSVATDSEPSPAEPAPRKA